MSERVLVDSDILIDVSRGISATTGLFSTTTQTARILISAVVQMELLVGCRNQSERQITERFLSRFEVVDINESISKEFRLNKAGICLHLTDMALPLRLNHREAP